MDDTAPIKLAMPMLGEAEEAAALQVLRSGYLVQGPRVAAFEAALAARCGRAHAVAVSNGTTALSLALEALGVGPGDEVLCPALTWPSPGHAILGRGARPVLVDVDGSEWNADPQAMARARSTRTRAAIAIDQFGNPARTAEILEALPDLPLIVDAACSLGATRSGQDCGKAGVIACMSFHPRKVLTTGEGGVCLTDDDALAETLRQLRNHGQASAGGFVRAAGNGRLTELQAAIGSCQLQRLPEILHVRRARGGRYAQLLAQAAPGVAPQAAAPGCAPNHQTYGVLLPARFGREGRDRVVATMRAAGIEAGLLSYALHTLPQFSQAAGEAVQRGQSLDNAATIAELGMALPMHPMLTEAQQDRVVSGLAHAMQQTGDLA